MSKQASPTLIGAFVLGGAALLVIFVLIIMGDSLNKKTQRYVIYFEGTINGLKTGSNVMFRGVPIGYVSNIEVHVDFDNWNVAVPVFIDIDDGAVREITERSRSIGPDEEFGLLIDRGLRASLATESMITGQLYIELDFHPDEPVVLRGINNQYLEIPSISSGIQAVIQDVQRFISEIQQKVDFDKLLKDVSEILDGFNRLINNNDTQNLGSELRHTLAKLQSAIGQFESTLANLDEDIEPAAESLTQALDKITSLLGSLEGQMRSDSAATYRLNNTMQEIENAARSIRILADYLEKNPEALIKGKQ
jgi:paraquat-inducible protein B